MGTGASLEDVKRWLVEGKDNPDTFVDLKWVVIEEEKYDGKLTSIRLTHPGIPINLIVTELEALGDESKIIRLAVETGIETIDLDAEDKLRVYRYLLELSKIPLAKFYLFGPDDEIGIAVDLDTKIITKEELETHMAAMLMGYSLFVELDMFEDQIVEEEAYILVRLVAKWMEKGLSKDKVLEKLISAGMDREVADKLIEIVYGFDESGERRKEENLFI